MTVSLIRIVFVLFLLCIMCFNINAQQQPDTANRRVRKGPRTGPGASSGNPRIHRGANPAGGQPRRIPGGARSVPGRAGNNVRAGGPGRPGPGGAGPGSRKPGPGAGKNSKGSPAAKGASEPISELVIEYPEIRPGASEVLSWNATQAGAFWRNLTAGTPQPVFIITPAYCGNQAMIDLLGAHPDVCLPERKVRRGGDVVGGCFTRRTLACHSCSEHEWGSIAFLASTAAGCFSSNGTILFVYLMARFAGDPLLRHCERGGRFQDPRSPDRDKGLRRGLQVSRTIGHGTRVYDPSKPYPRPLIALARTFTLSL